MGSVSSKFHDPGVLWPCTSVHCILANDKQLDKTNKLLLGRDNVTLSIRNRGRYPPKGRVICICIYIQIVHVYSFYIYIYILYSLSILCTALFAGDHKSVQSHATAVNILNSVISKT